MLVALYIIDINILMYKSMGPKLNIILQKIQHYNMVRGTLCQINQNTTLCRSQ